MEGYVYATFLRIKEEIVRALNRLEDVKSMQFGGWRFAGIGKFNLVGDWFTRVKGSGLKGNSEPSSLIQMESVDRRGYRFLSRSNLFFGGSSVSFGGGGGFSSYSHGAHGNNQLHDCAASENGTDDKSNHFYLQSCYIASFVAACAGIVLVYFGLRTS